MSQPRPISNDSRAKPKKASDAARSTSHVSEGSRKSRASGRLRRKKITAFQTFAPLRRPSHMNSDLQAAAIGIDSHEGQSAHDAEEAEEPLDYGMKAISANNDTDLATPAKYGNAEDADELMSPALRRSHDSPGSPYAKLAKQTTLMACEQDVVAE